MEEARKKHGRRKKGEDEGKKKGRSMEDERREDEGKKQKGRGPRGGEGEGVEEGLVRDDGASSVA